VNEFLSIILQIVLFLSVKVVVLMSKLESFLYVQKFFMERAAFNGSLWKACYASGIFGSIGFYLIVQFVFDLEVFHFGLSLIYMLCVNLLLSGHF
jgi:hypothetical protein